MPRPENPAKLAAWHRLAVVLAVIVAGCHSKESSLPATPQVPIETLSGFPDHADFSDGPFTLKTREPEDGGTGQTMQLLYRGSPITQLQPSLDGERKEQPQLGFARRVHNDPAAYVLSYDCKAVDLVMDAGNQPKVTALQTDYEPPSEEDMRGQNACAGLRLSMTELAFPGNRTVEDKPGDSSHTHDVHEVKVLNTDTLGIQTYQRPGHDAACMAGGGENCQTGQPQSSATSACP